MEIIEDGFSRKLSSSYELSILLGMDSFAYMVSDAQQRILLMKDLGFEPGLKSGDAAEDRLRDLMAEEKYLKLPHRNIRIGFINKTAVLVPERLYQEPEKQTYLGELLELGTDTEIRSDKLSSLSVYNVYALDRYLLDFAHRYFPGCLSFHISTPLLQGFSRHAAIEQGPQVYIHIRSGDIYIFHFDGARLVFANAFPYKSAKDFLYWAMLVYQQFNLDPDEAPVHLSGQLVEDSEIYRLLFRYIRHISFLQPPAFFQFGQKLNQQPAYFYFDHFCLLLC